MTDTLIRSAPVAVPVVTTERRRPVRRGGSHLVAHIVLGGGGLLMAFPFVWQIIMSLSTNAEVQSCSGRTTPTCSSACRSSRN
jgi:ABC-type glycerol-3-phosphate transport system permease component